MGIETKYEYTYYTVIDTEQWRTGIEAMEEVQTKAPMWQFLIQQPLPDMAQ